MNFRPLHDRVLVRRVEAEAKTAGGIIIPDTAQEKPQEGEVVSVGSGTRGDDGSITPLDDLSRALCRCNHDIAVVNGTVIALEQQRPGIRFDAVNRSAGNSRNFAVADDVRAVQIVGQHAADERDIHRLPLGGSARHVLARRDEPVETAEMM